MSRAERITRTARLLASRAVVETVRDPNSDESFETVARAIRLLREIPQSAPLTPLKVFLHDLHHQVAPPNKWHQIAADDDDEADEPELIRSGDSDP